MRSCDKHMDVDYFRFLVRYIMKRRRDPIVDERAFITFNNQVRRLSDLIDHKVGGVDDDLD